MSTFKIINKLITQVKKSQTKSANKKTLDKIEQSMKNLAKTTNSPQIKGIREKIKILKDMNRKK